MKIRVLLVLTLIFPFSLKGQIQENLTENDNRAKNTIFYNRGDMYVAPNKSDANTSTIFVQGSIKVVVGSNIRQMGVTSLIGDFISSDTDNANSSNRNIFLNTPSQPSTGTIRFMNAHNMENPLSVAYGQATNTGNGKKSVFGNISELTELKDIRLNTKQEIRLEGGANKKHDYIDFPNVELADNTYVALKADAAATIKKLITNYGSVFSVEGRYQRSGGVPGINGEGILYGHLILREKSERKFKAVTDPNAIFSNGTLQSNYSYHMLDVSLYDYSDFGTNKNRPTSNKFTDAAVHLSGITSPFKKLSNSYFMFHTIFNPTKIWDKFEPNINPKEFINAGEGYTVAMELSDNDHSDIESNWHVNREERAAGGFQFSTLFLAQKSNFLIGSKRKIKDPISQNELTNTDFQNYWENEEFLNTSLSSSNDIVKVELKETRDLPNQRSKFFLANPFLAPFELTALMHGIEANSEDARKLGVTAGNDPASYNLNSAFWVLSQSALEYKPNIMANFYRLNYLSYKKAGATGYLGVDEVSSRYFIAPQQIFAVEVGNLPNKVEFNFHPDYVSHNHLIATKSGIEQTIKDEFLIQVIDEDDNTEDRLAVVFRDDATSAYGERGDKYDDRKDDLKYRLNTKVGIMEEQRRAAIYTKTIDGKEMRTNAVPTNTKSLPLYVTPTVTPKRLVLKPYRLETLQSVEGVWLEDKQQKNIIQLHPDTEYAFESTIENDRYAQENRFVLHFSKLDINDNIADTQSPIFCYYQNSILFIRGLSSIDINSKVEIFDLQGRLITQTKIDNAPDMSYAKHLDIGTYIVRITGNRNYTTKIMSLSK